MSAQSEAIPWSQLTLLPGDSHVRMSQSQGNAQVSKTAPGQDSGQSFTESFANYDPDTSSWRTSQACLLTGWEEFLETWPTSGTMRNGRCYRRQMSAHRTSGKGSSLWPTPRGSEGGVGMVGGTGHWEMLQAKTDSKEEALAMGAGNGGKLNPTWVEWLMGFPDGWTDLRD